MFHLSYLHQGRHGNYHGGEKLKKKIHRPSCEYTTNHLCCSGQVNFKRGDIKCSSKADCLSMEKESEWFITQPGRVALKAHCKLTPFYLAGLRDMKYSPFCFLRKISTISIFSLRLRLTGFIDIPHVLPPHFHFLTRQQKWKVISKNPTCSISVISWIVPPHRALVPLVSILIISSHLNSFSIPRCCPSWFLYSHFPTRLHPIPVSLLLPFLHACYRPSC